MPSERTPATIALIQQTNGQHSFRNENITNAQLSREALNLGKHDSATKWASKQEVIMIKTIAKAVITKHKLSSVNWNKEDSIKIGSALNEVSILRRR